MTIELCIFELVWAWGQQLYQKRDCGTGVFLWNLQIFKNTFLTEHLRATASACMYPLLLRSS